MLSFSPLLSSAEGLQRDLLHGQTRSKDKHKGPRQTGTPPSLTHAFSLPQQLVHCTAIVSQLVTPRSKLAAFIDGKYHLCTVLKCAWYRVVGSGKVSQACFYFNFGKMCMIIVWSQRGRKEYISAALAMFDTSDVTMVLSLC